MAFWASAPHLAGTLVLTLHINRTSYLSLTNRLKYQDIGSPL